MAYLVKCSLCGRDVSNETKSCPGCGHDVAHEIYQKERKKKDAWEEQGLCGECGSNKFKKERELTDYTQYGSGISIRIYGKCIACGWKDKLNSVSIYPENQPWAPWNSHKDYRGQLSIHGRGVEYGKREIDSVVDSDLKL